MAQFLKIDKDTTFADLCKLVGRGNVEDILVANQLHRTPHVGQEFKEKCQSILDSASGVKEPTWERKSAILNTLTDDAELFESAALLSSDGWKILDALGTFTDRLKVPEKIKLPQTVDVIGGSSQPVESITYTKAMKSLKSTPHTIDSSIFGTYSTIAPPDSSASLVRSASGSGVFTAFKFPVGKVSLYSSLSNTMIDFPVYPEEISDSYKASYDTMPDTLYQYEPWYTYSNSGPRTNSYSFHFHRDMWTGDHRDGKANELVRFCQANCYPEYNGSAVNAPTVTLYISGKNHISGILTDVNTRWKGPLGQDDWYLECELELTITEVAKSPRSFDSVRQLGLIGE